MRRVILQRVLMGYAWPQRPSEFSTIGGHHIVLTDALHDGRIHRQAGDALCKPASKFWGLDTDEGERRRLEGQTFDCRRCAVLNKRLHLVETRTDDK